MKFIRSTAFAVALGMSGVAPAAVTVTSDPILFWNERATTLMVAGPPIQTRAYAMMNIAMYDAVNSILGGPNRYYTSGVSGFGGDIRAAVSQAAFGVMSVLDAPNIGLYQAALDNSLALVGDPAPSDSSLGIQASRVTVARRLA